MYLLAFFNYTIGVFTEFPSELEELGLSEEVLFSSIRELQTESDCSFKLWETPTIGFYQMLHKYLNKTAKLIKRFNRNTVLLY